MLSLMFQHLQNVRDFNKTFNCTTMCTFGCGDGRYIFVVASHTGDLFVLNYINTE